MKIFITGISSQIMQQFVAKIDTKKHQVIGLSRNPECLNLKNVEMVKGDIQEPKQFERCLEGCNLIIHAAAVTHSFRRTPYYKVNAKGTKELVDLSNKYKVQRFVFISSNTAGTQNGAYGESKYYAEKYIKNNVQNWLIIKLSEVFGTTKKEGIDALIQKVIKNRVVFCPIAIPCKLYPIHLKDAVIQIEKNIFNFNTLNNVVVVLNGAKGYSFYEVISLIKSISKNKPKIIFIKKRWMFIIKTIVEIFPFNIGIIPDQIDRLYGKKTIVVPTNNLSTKLDTYISEIKEK